MTTTWMKLPNEPAEPYIGVFRCRFEGAGKLDFRFSADETAQLYLDGQRLTEGPERGAPTLWYWKRVSVEIPAGRHVLSARVLCFGSDYTATGQITIRHGLCIDDASGMLKDWEAREEDCLTFTRANPDCGAFPRVEVHPGYCDQIPLGGGDGWKPVEYFKDDRRMMDGELPEMRYEEVMPIDKGNGVFFFEHYTNSWARIDCKGKGVVKIRFCETVYHTDDFPNWKSYLTADKGKRDGKYLVGNEDVFHVDGTLHWDNYWWRAGHYIQVKVDGDVEVKIRYFKTGYPLPDFTGDCELGKMAVETLQSCMYYTYMDCPFWEQLQYVGDTRLTTLCTYKLTSDHKLPEKALRMFSLSQQADGAIMSRYPTKDPQYIPSFMTIWLLMLHDYWKIHGRTKLLDELLPAAGRLLDFYDANSKDGLVDAPGWNFVDWCTGWDFGAPLKGDGPDSMNNWLLVMALRGLDEIGLRPGLNEKADRLVAKIKEKYYVPERKLYSIDLAHKEFSEHSQVLAILAGEDPSEVEGLRHEELTECSIYFSFYYAAACRMAGWEDMVQRRMGRWNSLLGQGLTTLPEEFGLTRSDCHAWGAYILMYLDVLDTPLGKEGFSWVKKQ